FADHPGVQEVRDAEQRTDGSHTDAVFDPGGWNVLSNRLGLASLGAPPEVGGMGLGLELLSTAAHECGVNLYPGPARAAMVLSWMLQQFIAEHDRVPESMRAAVDDSVTGDRIVGMAVGTGHKPS